MFVEHPYSTPIGGKFIVNRAIQVLLRSRELCGGRVPGLQSCDTRGMEEPPLEGL